MNASQVSALGSSSCPSPSGRPERGIQSPSGLIELTARLLSSGLLLILMGGSGGCISVHITDGRGQVQTIRQVGMLRVEMPSPEQAIVGSLSGLGVIGAPLGWSVGYTQQRWALIGSACRAVVWVAPGAAMDERTRDGLARLAGVCLLDDETTLLSTQLTEVTP